MNNETEFHLIATFHAMASAEKGDPWLCQCLACKFTKEHKILIEAKDGSVREATIGEALVVSLKEQGYTVNIL